MGTGRIEGLASHIAPTLLLWVSLGFVPFALPEKFVVKVRSATKDLGVSLLFQ